MEKIAVITGGGSGIGFAIAQKMVESKIDVIIVGRTETKLQKAVSKLKLFGTAEYIKADLANQEEVENVIHQVIQKKGNIDYLINNAGINIPLSTETPLEEIEEIWNNVINANLKSAFLMSIVAAPYLNRQTGRIVNISSIGAFTGGSSKGAIAYSSAKAGILGLTRALARELTPKGITVNAVAPGFTYPTDFFGDNLPDEIIKNYEKQIPAGRAGTPNEVASTVKFLLSEEAAYISGEVINVNGGWLFGK